MFEQALKFTLRHEGGYSNDPHDKGGETNYGISRRFLDTTEFASLDLKTITLNQVSTIYKTHFWNHRYENIKDKTLAIKLFDFGVNIGKATSVRILQSVVDSKEDGIFGHRTLSLVNSCQGPLLTFFINEVGLYYLNICEKHPNQRRFLSGWLRRCYDLATE